MSEAIDNEDVDVIYLDFKKAFDKVPHKLLKKLRRYGTRGKVYALIKKFLTNRRQRVVVNGQYSEWKNVTSGILQDSVLVPILFIIFINDTRVLQKVLSLGSDYFRATFYQTYFYYKPSKYSPFTETHFCNLFTQCEKQINSLLLVSVGDTDK